MTQRTPEQWRRLVEKELGKIPNEVWNVVCEKDCIDAADNETAGYGVAEGLKYLIEVTDGELVSFEHYHKAGPRLPQQQPKKMPRELPQKEVAPAVNQTEALSKTIAILAGKEKPVQDFRSKFLNGRLLQPDEALPWIRTTGATEALDQEACVSFSAGLDVKLDHGSLTSECVRAAVSGRIRSVKFSFPTLSCLAPSGKSAETIPIASRGVLATLKKIASEYAAFWPEAAAVRFILTGQNYPVRRAVVTYGSDKPAMPWVSMRLHPCLSGDEVRAIYLAARKRLEGWPGVTDPKGLTEKHQALAIFAVEQPGSWSRLLRMWNKSCPPEWVYPVADKNLSHIRSTFARDCRAAYTRLTGWPWVEKK
jgi:hypothetical protein